MANYGFRISENGKDVKTCLDRECVVTSKYALSKGAVEGSGNISASGYEEASGEITINHNLGFIPIVRVFMDNGTEFIEIPHTAWAAGVFIFDTYYEHISVDQTEIYAYLWVSGENVTINQDYKWYISNEKVNI